jgi:DNA-directed RNA polymerase subunit RPC12/RpoP
MTMEDLSKIPDTCPHCGHKLSPWQQVLLNVDRTITCKNCWYRIILEPDLKKEDQKDQDKSSKFEED